MDTLTIKKNTKTQKITNLLYIIGVSTIVMLIIMNIAEYAFAGTFFDTIKDAAKALYTDVKGIATIIAIASIAVALVVSFLSHNQRAVDASRTIIKGIIASWIFLMLLGPIFDYAGKYFDNNGNIG